MSATLLAEPKRKRVVISTRERRGGIFPHPAHMTQSEAIVHLGRQVFEDAVAAGWLTEAVRKPGKGKDTVFYAFSSVNDVSLRIAAGTYPPPKKKGEAA